MSDPRIKNLVDALRRMRTGDFHVDIPVDGRDDVSQLSQALLKLSRTLEQQFQQFRTLQDITRRVNAGLLLDQVCEHVYDAFRDTIPYDRIGLALLEDDGTQLRACWARSEAPAIHLPVNFSAPMAGSSLERILETGHPRILNDLEAYLAAHPHSRSTQLVVREGVRSSLTCPLVAEGQAIGFLFFSSFAKDTYKDQHVAVYQMVARQLSIIVEKSRIYEELLALNHLKDRMLGIAAHDLRNPLTLVLGNLELLQMGLGGELTPEGLTLLRRASTAAERMVTLVEDLLDVSAIESGELLLSLELVDLRAWLIDFVQQQQILARSKDITLVAQLTEEPLMMRIDPHRMDQVITNLVSNAIKFSQPGTQVFVAARADGGDVLIEVTDEGPGIPLEEQSQLFQPFGRTSVRPTGGETSTGLGLAISRRVVEAHGGTLNVESRPGAGSSFTARLPRS